ATRPLERFADAGPATRGRGDRARLSTRQPGRRLVPLRRARPVPLTQKRRRQLGGQRRQDIHVERLLEQRLRRQRLQGLRQPSRRPLMPAQKRDPEIRAHVQRGRKRNGTAQLQYNRPPASGVSSASSARSAASSRPSAESASFGYVTTTPTIARVS